MMMNVMTYRGYHARVDYDGEDNLLVGRLGGINDVVSFHALSLEALRAAFEEAVDDYVETCAKLGKAPEKPYSGNLMLRVPPSVHAGAALVAQLSGQSLNEWSSAVLRDAVEKNLGAANAAAVKENAPA